MDPTLMLAGGALAAYLAWSNKDVVGARMRRLFSRDKAADSGLRDLVAGFESFDSFATANDKPEVRDHAAKAFQCALERCKEHGGR